MPEPQPTSATRMPLVQPRREPVESREDPGHQRQPGPGGQHPLHPVGRRWSQIVIGQAPAGPEGVRQPVHHLGRRDPALEGARREPEAALLVGQHLGRFRAQLEGLTIGGVDQTGRRLAAQPFEQPALVQTGPGGQAGRRDGPCPAMAR